MTSKERLKINLKAIGRHENASYSTDEREFHQLVQVGALNIIKSIIAKHSYYVNLKSGTIQWTPLHVAIKYNKIDAVKLLIESGANIEATDAYHSTPLHYAVQYSSIDFVKYLVEKGANVNAIDGYQNALLHKAAAAENGALDMIKYFVESHGASVNATNVFNKTPLHYAASRTNLEIVEYLLKNGAHIHCRDIDDRTPLHEAAKWSTLEMFKYLLDRAGDVYVKSKEGKTVLHDACDEANMDVIKYLIDECNLSVDINDNSRNTPLHCAASAAKTNLKLVKYLVQKGCNVNAKNIFGESVLYNASAAAPLDVIKYIFSLVGDIIEASTVEKSLFQVACGNNVAVVKYFVEERGADVNDTFDDFCMPIHVATEFEKIEIIEYLLEKGATVNCKTHSGSTPIFWAAKNCGLKTIKYLISKGADYANVRDPNRNDTILHVAAEHNSCDILEYLIDELHFDIGIKNCCDETALHCAAKSYKLIRKEQRKNDFGIPTLQSAVIISPIEKVKFLIKRKAAANDARTKDKKTLLHLACEPNNLDIVKYLVEQLGADVNALDSNNRTPLHCACEYGTFETMKYLVEKGASVNVKSADGMTPLHFVAQWSNLEAIKLLLSKNADIHAENCEGIQPLYMAVKNMGSIDKIKLFLNYGANIFTKTYSQQTVLHVAARKGLFDVVKYLVEEFDFDRNARDENDFTALDYAKHYYRKNIVDYLRANT